MIGRSSLVVKMLDSACRPSALSNRIDSESRQSRRHGDLHRLTTARQLRADNEGQVAVSAKNIGSNARDRTVVTADSTSGGSPRRARRREIVNVIRVRELVDSADPTTDVSLPVWAREVVREGRITVRRSAMPDGAIVVVIPARSQQGWHVSFTASVEDFVILSGFDDGTSWGQLWICKRDSFSRIFEVVESS